MADSKLSPTLDELQARIDELEERLARHEERTEPMSAETMYETAKAWIEANPQIWELVKSKAMSRARRNQRVSMQRIVEELRDQYGLVWQTENFKIANGCVAPLARFLVAECPKVKDHIRLGRSKVDRYFS